MYDNRVGRFLTMDPCAIESPGESPYMFAGNSPVMYIDENGEFKMRKGLQQKYPMLTNLLRNLETLAKSDPKVWEAFKANMGMTEAQAVMMVKWDSGPRIRLRNLKNVVREEGDPTPNVEYDKTYGGFNGRVVLNKKMVKVMEGTRANPDLTQGDAAVLTFITALHAPQHSADKALDGQRTKTIGQDVGDRFEEAGFGKDYHTDNVKQFKADKMELHEQILEKTGLPREDTP
jgi:hypothetical protein